MLPEISLLIELLVAGMLAVMIYFAWRLNEKLTALQDDKAQLEQLLATFAESTERAESSVLRLKQSATDCVDTIEDRISQATSLRDDLTFLVDRANEMADRLEGSISAGRPAEGGAKAVVRARETRPAAPESEDAAADTQRNKSELLKALEGMR